MEIMMMMMMVVVVYLRTLHRPAGYNNIYQGPPVTYIRREFAFPEDFQNNQSSPWVV